MRIRARQSGITVIGFIFVAALALMFAMIGFRVLPSYIEYFSVEKTLRQTLQNARDGMTQSEFQRDFDLKASADYVESVRGADVELSKQDNHLTATATWSKTLHLVGNMSILLDFQASATK